MQVARANPLGSGPWGEGPRSTRCRNGIVPLFQIPDELRIMALSEQIRELVDFTKANGLVTAIAQDAESGEILMVANMNEESLARSIELGEAVYWSRSRRKLWHKGEESGNIQKIVGLYLDCDGDAVLLKVKQIGDAACHTGKRSCFFRKLDDDGVTDVGVQVFDPKERYKK